MSKPKLSDRLKDSAKELLEIHLKSRYVSEFLMNGSGSDNPTKVAHNLLKDSLDFLTFTSKIMEIPINRIDSEEEKNVFKKCLEMEDVFKAWIQKFTEKFGNLDKDMASLPMTQTVWSYKQHLFKELTLGSILEMLTAMLPMYWVSVKVADYVTANPNFNPNPYFEILSFEEFNFEGFALLLEAMIDSRDEISIEEEEHLCELFKRSVIFEMKIFKSAMNSEKWYE